jgi:DNA replication protein DnaC
MAARTASATARDLGAELAFLTRALKAPTLRQSVTRLAERARAAGWSHEEFLAACLHREVAARQAHGGEGRIRHARFPARKRLEEFDFDHARGRNRDTVAHLGTLDFVTAREHVVFLGPPGTGKTHPGDRAGHPGLPGRPPGGMAGDRLAVGRPPGRGPHRRPAAG